MTSSHLPVTSLILARSPRGRIDGALSLWYLPTTHSTSVLACAMQINRNWVTSKGQLPRLVQQRTDMCVFWASGTHVSSPNLLPQVQDDTG